jgi:uncharacterized phage protein (TIGR01671 family)
MSEIKLRAWFIPEKKMYSHAFQKWFHVLLCEEKAGKVTPIRRARYDDCVLLQSTTLEDKNGREIFEGDRIKIRTAQQVIESEVGEVPDMMKSRHLHPLQAILEKYHLDPSRIIELEVMDNIYIRPSE